MAGSSEFLILWIPPISQVLQKSGGTREEEQPASQHATQGQFSKYDPSKHWCPWLDTLKRRSECRNTPLMTLHYVVYINVYIPTCLAYITCSHTSTIQPNNPRVKCMGEIFDWAKENFIIITVDKNLSHYFLAQIFTFYPHCSVVSLTNNICQK